MSTKSNKPLRAAGILLIAAMLTTCMTAGTFAKYTTGASGSDSARVAKFGVVTQIDGTLFGEEYNPVDAATNGNNPIGFSGDNYTGTVQVHLASTKKTVVAPGTKNDTGLAISTTGTPEVDVEVSTTASGSDIYLKAGSYATLIQNTQITEENFEADTYYVLDSENNNYALAGDYDSEAAYYNLVDDFTLYEDYYPVIYTFTGFNPYATNLTQFAAYVSNLNGTTVQSNNDISIFTYLGDVVITWEWPFEHGSNDYDKATFDKADTYLANLSVSGYAGVLVKADSDDSSKYVPVTTEDYSLEASLAMSITITQID